MDSEGGNVPYAKRLGVSEARNEGENRFVILQIPFSIIFPTGVDLSADKRPASTSRLKAFMRVFVKTLRGISSKHPTLPFPEENSLPLQTPLNRNLRTRFLPYISFFFRALHSTRAIIAPPCISHGRENVGSSWNESFQTLSAEIKQRIIGLICDGNRSLVGIAKRNGWILQRCHFHLKHRLANYIRTGKMAKRRELGLRIKKLVDIILVHPRESEVRKAILGIAHLLPSMHSRFLKTHLSGFIRQYRDFRSYLYYPEFHLPHTSNVVESFNNMVRDLQHRARGFRSKTSFEKWVIALCKHRKYMTCNGKNFPPNKSV